jgi:hypothetical protein
MSKYKYFTVQHTELRTNTKYYSIYFSIIEFVKILKFTLKIENKIFSHVFIRFRYYKFPFVWHHFNAYLLFVTKLKICNLFLYSWNSVTAIIPTKYLYKGKDKKVPPENNQNIN